MCGRFSFSPTDIIIEERFDISLDDEFRGPRYNCAPSQELAVISSEAPTKLSYYKWGLIPFWAKDAKIGNKLINARAETITEKPSFRNSLKSKRCLVLSDGFYEWKKVGKEKIPYRITLSDNSPFAMAGIWDIWKNPDGNLIKSFSIITTEANELMQELHHRMPVILNREDEKSWLLESKQDNVLKLLKPYPSELMDSFEISNLVNSPYNELAEVMKAVV
ncbi:MAG: SOS response-associated peptidase [Saprospiraceae bacterium]|nr:SOS response-associated peptidase [Saprospiraceae bacterium]